MTASLRATTIYALIITSILVGCARRPAPTAMTAPAPTAVTAERSAEPAAATAPRAEERIVTRQEEISVARRPDPATFAENDSVKTIYFDFDRYDIRPGEVKTLEADAAWLKTHDVLILIEGQCDERGTVEYNLALGDRRARAAMNHLVALGIAADRITTVSYGKERPVCDAHDESCWALNRRAHIVVKSRG